VLPKDKSEPAIADNQPRDERRRDANPEEERVPKVNPKRDAADRRIVTPETRDRLDAKYKENDKHDHRRGLGDGKRSLPLSLDRRNVSPALIVAELVEFRKCSPDVRSRYPHGSARSFPAVFERP
jgi:hypothetical protein